MLSLSAAAMAASAADQRTGAVAAFNYQQERERCIDGRSTEDQATCLKEAAAALAAARRGRLSEGDESYRQNALARCEPLRGDDRRDCVARVEGHGIASGSVAGGGILRETHTLELTPLDPATVDRAPTDAERPADSDRARGSEAPAVRLVPLEPQPSRETAPQRRDAPAVILVPLEPRAMPAR